MLDIWNFKKKTKKNNLLIYFFSFIFQLSLSLSRYDDFETIIYYAVYDTYFFFFFLLCYYKHKYLNYIHICVVYIQCNFVNIYTLTIN